MNVLPAFTEKTKEFCLYAGIAGVLFSIISTVHVFAAAAAINWFTAMLVIPNLSAGLSFWLLLQAHRRVLILLNITLVLFVFYFVFVFYLLANFVLIFSPSTLLLFLYNLAIVIYAYITDLPAKLRERYTLLQEEAAYWDNKL